MNSNSLQLRAIETTETDRVRSMAEKIWPEAYGSILEPGQITYMLDRMYSAQTIQTEIEQKQISYFWLHHDSEQIGFLAIGPGDAPGTLFLHKLYLLPQFQGKGFAHEALALLIFHPCCEESTTLELRVNRHNRRAIAFYTREGFAIVREDVAEIGGGFVMDDFVMRLDLSPRDSP